MRSTQQWVNNDMENRANEFLSILQNEPKDIINIPAEPIVLTLADHYPEPTEDEDEDDTE
jgi:hypothetical protein